LQLSLPERQQRPNRSVEERPKSVQVTLLDGCACVVKRENASLVIEKHADPDHFGRVTRRVRWHEDVFFVLLVHRRKSVILKQNKRCMRFEAAIYFVSS